MIQSCTAAERLLLAGEVVDAMTDHERTERIDRRPGLLDEAFRYNLGIAGCVPGVELFEGTAEGASHRYGDTSAPMRVSMRSSSSRRMPNGVAVRIRTRRAYFFFCFNACAGMRCPSPFARCASSTISRSQSRRELRSGVGVLDDLDRAG